MSSIFQLIQLLLLFQINKKTHKSFFISRADFLGVIAKNNIYIQKKNKNSYYTLKILICCRDDFYKFVMCFY